MRWLVRRMRRLRLRQLLLLGEAAGWLVLAKFALRVVPVRFILAWKQESDRSLRTGETAEARIAEVAWAVAAVARRSPIEFVCFPQSLAAHAMLAGRGIATRLHYGAARLQGRLESHAWLEAGGQIVTGAEQAEAFTTLAIY